MKQIIQSYKFVFSKPSYLVSAIIIAFLFYSLNVLIFSYVSLKSVFLTTGLTSSISLFMKIALQFYSQLKLHSYISLLINSILIGSLIPMLFYKAKLQAPKKKKNDIFASIGIFFAAIAPGCAACGIGIISALGAGGIVIALLPFEGLEISILAIIILLFANYKLSKDLFLCKTNFTKGFKYQKNPD